MVSYIDKKQITKLLYLTEACAYSGLRSLCLCEKAVQFVCVCARAPLCIFLCDSRGCNRHDSAAAGKELGGAPCESSPHLQELTALSPPLGRV